MAQTPKELYLCKTPTEQAAWIKQTLQAGRVLSDAGLWLAGVDQPSRVVASLRGLAIVTTKKWIRDAADKWHHDLAWRLESTPEPVDPRPKRKAKGLKLAS